MSRNRSRGRGSRKDKQKNTKGLLLDAVLKVFHKNPTQALNYKQVSRKLGMNTKTKRNLVLDVLIAMAAQDHLTEVKTGFYKLQFTETYITGTVEMTASGAAFIIPDTDELGMDVFIGRRHINRAMNGDHVKVFLFPRKGKGKPEGEIVEVLQRRKNTHVGIIEMHKEYAFLIPDDQRAGVDLFIPKTKLNGAEHGEKAVARITDWPEGNKNPFAEIVEVLGEPGANETEIHAILFEYGLPHKFQPEVEEYANQISLELDPEEIARRRDFREVTTFTIDPADAKDFDDALSFQTLENGRYEIGVHIADVTHYMPEGSPLDEDAFERGTSVYLVDRVVPMLPERLSNGVCSLRPNEEKFCFSAVFEIDDDAKIHNQWFGRTTIYSDRRFTYEEAQEIIETGEGDYSHEVLTLDKIAKKFRAKRFKSGAVNFDKIEVKFNLDEEGKPLGVFFKIAKDSNQLIEEFMLLANRSVAAYIGKPLQKGGKENTFVYRIHDKPPQDKLDTLTQFVSRFGYEFNASHPRAVSGALNQLMQDIKGAPEENLIETLAIRSMSKAEYSTQNIGHYGLAFDYYSHFTSPIRRYPDVMVHRLLQHYLDKGKSPDAESFEEQCKHCSARERVAAEAERASIKYKQVEYLSDKIGEEFEATISGVTEWGMFAEITENGCEGMIRTKEIEGDVYYFDQDEMAMIGHHTKNVLRLGDKIIIRVRHADLMKKQLDFDYISSASEAEGDNSES